MYLIVYLDLTFRSPVVECVSHLTTERGISHGRRLAVECEFNVRSMLQAVEAGRMSDRSIDHGDAAGCTERSVVYV